MPLYRKATPEEISEKARELRAGIDALSEGMLGRPPALIAQAAVVAAAGLAAPRRGGNVVETRKADRHKDRKAHSAKTAARAKAKRAAK